MTLLGLKQILNSMPENELDQQLVYNSESQSISGEVITLKKAVETLYWDGEDDPSKLLTVSDIEDMGEDPDDYEIEILVGQYYLEL